MLKDILQNICTGSTQGREASNKVERAEQHQAVCVRVLTEHNNKTTKKQK